MKDDEKSSYLTGNIKPSIEKQKAPIRPIKGAMVGTETAKTTAAVTKTVLKMQTKQIIVKLE